MIIASGLWVDALRRRVEQAGAFAFVARKGEPRFGSVIIKVLDLTTREAYVLREAQQGEQSVWMRPIETRNEADLDSYIDRQVRFDPDLWVIEIEDRGGRHFLTEPVVED